MPEPVEPNPVARMLANFAKPLRQFFSFWRTRTAVREGEPLYLLRRDELRKRQLMGPWTFNLYEVAVAGLPVVVLLKILDLGAYIDLRPSAFLEPLLAPITTTVYVYLIARASLKPKDFSSDKLARARHAYLYLDGAYGLWAQAALGFGWALLLLQGSERGWVPRWVPIIVMIAALIRLFHLTWFAIPARLFSVNGYDPRLSVRDQSVGAPWTRYTKRLGRLGLLLAIAIALAYLIVSFGIEQLSTVLRDLG